MKFGVVSSMHNLSFTFVCILIVSLCLWRGRNALGSLAVIFGFLFPIDVLESVNPLLIDGFRYILALILIMFMRAEPRSRNEMALLATLILAALNIIAMSRALFAERADIAMQSLVGVGAIILAYFVTKSAFLNRKMLLGFVFGIAWSALDIILQYSGLAYLGTTSEWGTRYAGLGLNSTNTAPFLAIGLVLVLSNYLWLRSTPVTLLRVSTGLLLAFGLLLSGGRGGIAGLAFAVVIFLFVQLRKHPLLVLTIGTLG